MATRHDKSNRYGGVKVAARNMPDGVSHGQYGQAEGQRDPDKTDAHFGESGCQHGRTTTPENKPEGSYEFCYGFFSK